MDFLPMAPMGDMSPLGGTPAPGKPDLTLSRKAKAAIVVRLLLNEGADIPLEDLPEELQEQLTKQMGQMRVVDRDTLQHVVQEFAEEVERIGLSFPGGIAGALSALDGKISPKTAARLAKEANVRETGDPWVRIKDVGSERLVPVMQEESIEVAAVLLSKLDVTKAAEILGKLPGPRARQITFAVSQTGAVTPDAVDRIGRSIADQLSALPLRAFDEDPVDRVGAILNSSTSVTRDDVLEGLDERDEGFANAVRKAIFTFGNIAERIAPRDLPRVLRDIDQADLIAALGGAEAAGMKASADFILENMSGRMADQLREEIEEAGKQKPADVEAAMSNIVATIRALEASGDLLLISPDEDEE
ncbi:Flagellar motor switch protein FliG [Ascidiaceihabitans donghaensis]|uniref:Flagellar motor switch protein FliG n=1 Tax=Ascidiaceihabitans donghaensis TaxID=1510460 RepID=A0A2R8BD06_9RHOB|nr:FliG C-terminal domain-containing protein [Ascidiaceihabitans donghaensis]SPH20818.1 Flagellar motor switch protein FliG [Ascidiaceihabitans donghaensis]